MKKTGVTTRLIVLNSIYYLRNDLPKNKWWRSILKIILVKRWITSSATARNTKTLNTQNPTPKIIIKRGFKIR